MVSSKKYENALDYMPDDYEYKNICSQWLWNLCNIYV